MKRYVMVLSIFALFFPLVPQAYSDVHDPLDPFDISEQIAPQGDPDKDKTPQELILEAAALLEDQRLLDGRTKLLKALQKDPKQYRAHIMLAGYYMVHIGHFRLALKYIKQAQALFEEKNGKPPYTDPIAQAEHAHLLYVLSQVRLSMDDYRGALDVLDSYTSYGYAQDWYTGTRAWVLMKLGRLEEATKTARIGVLAGAEPGRTLNMLGILLSMQHQRENSIKIFKDAVTYELSLGQLGQPATPLNNIGEVYKEIFDEDKAESSWLKATGLPDGCEHVLPSLNLSLLYIEELNFAGAKHAMDSFESCVAQYPLRNGEEHRALVGLARGRIEMHTGHIDDALKHLESARERRQWFGKIGTNQEDLDAAGLVSLAEALTVKNNHLKFHRPAGFRERLASLKSASMNRLRSWWLMRRARQVLTEDLENLEDIYVRNTDSLIEYPTFGHVLAHLPASVLEKRIKSEEGTDKRKGSEPYYKLYLAENYIAHGKQNEGFNLLNEVIASARERYDGLLKIHALSLTLPFFKPHDPEYSKVTHAMFSLSRASVRNYGFQLPVNYSITDSRMIAELNKSAFFLDNGTKLKYSIAGGYSNGEYVLHFNSSNLRIGSIKVTGSDLRDAINNLTDQVFSEELK